MCEVRCQNFSVPSGKQKTKHIPKTMTAKLAKILCNAVKQSQGGFQIQKGFSEYTQSLNSNDM